MAILSRVVWNPQTEYPLLCSHNTGIIDITKQQDNRTAPLVHQLRPPFPITNPPSHWFLYTILYTWSTMMTGWENNSSSGGLSKSKPIAAVGASLTRSSTPVLTQWPRKRVSQQFSEPIAKSKTNIRWSDELLDELANAIARDYVQYKTGNKIEFGQK